MSEPTGPVRDSSRQDRKAPGKELRRTPQPRNANVMRGRAGRHRLVLVIIDCDPMER